MSKQVLMASTLAELVADHATPVQCEADLKIGDHFFDLDQGDYRKILQKVFFRKTVAGGLVQEGICYIFTAVTP